MWTALVQTSTESTCVHIVNCDLYVILHGVMKRAPYSGPSENLRTAVCVNVAIFNPGPTFKLCACVHHFTDISNTVNNANSEKRLKMAISCEPKQGRAYSDELRWRMVWQREVLGYKYHTVAENLNVDVSTVWRVVKLFKEFGSVDKKHYSRSELFQKLTPPLELHVLHSVLINPGIYLREIQEDLYETTDVDVSPSAICRFLHRVGFTRQKLKVVAKKRDEDLRAQFACDVAMYKPEMLVFLDETGSDRRDSLRKYGYSLRGRPAVSQKLLVRGERVSAIAFMSVHGLLDLKIVSGSVDGDIYCDFVEILLPQLMPFDGKNPHSVVNLDNCTIHHYEEAVQMIQEVGAIVHFLPHSLDYNPIGEAFSKVKAEMKAMEKEAQVLDIETVVLSAFSCITVSDCNQWIKDSVIYC